MCGDVRVRFIPLKKRRREKLGFKDFLAVCYWNRNGPWEGCMKG